MFKQKLSSTVIKLVSYFEANNKREQNSDMREGISECRQPKNSNFV
jgi:hypothetical protein